MDDKIHKYIAISSFGEVTLYKHPSDENSKILGGKTKFSWGQELA